MKLLQLQPAAVFRYHKCAIRDLAQVFLSHLLHAGQILLPGFQKIHMVGDHNLAATDNPKAVRLLTIYASVYQNESEVKNFNTSWGIRKRFANGTSAKANTPCYGYCRNKDGELAVLPEEAAIVQYIYNLRSQGLSLREIKYELERCEIKSPHGKPTWGVETIRRILENEKYKGHVLLQKTYVSNFFTGKRTNNGGELPKYLIKCHHEAIIDSEDF